MTDEPSRGRARLWIFVRALLGLGGIGVVVWLIDGVGAGALWDVVRPALPWIPVAAALEVGRIGMEALSSRYTLGRRGGEVPYAPLFLSHLVAYAVMGAAPAGRATSEAVKATLLARWIGAPTAASLGTLNQANVLLSSGTFTLLSAGAAYVVTGMSVLTWALLVHFGLMNVFGVALRAAARYRRFGAWLAKKIPKLEAEIAAFVDASRETSLYPFAPVFTMIVGRALQAAHFGVLMAAVGITRR